MMSPPPDRPRRDRVIVVTAAVLGSAVLVGGVAWVGGLRPACACPGSSPLGAYYQLGEVTADPGPGTPNLAVYQIAVSAGVNATAPAGWPIGPPLSTLGFQVVAPNGFHLAISILCAVAPNGTVLGTWSGSTGSWAGQPSGTPAGCGARVAPSGGQPPGSNPLAAGTVLYYYLEHPAAAGSVFTVAVVVYGQGSSWSGSISQSLASGGVVWDRSTPA
jgi:hypothetical protein